jgi:hypothetical protein
MRPSRPSFFMSWQMDSAITSGHPLLKPVMPNTTPPSQQGRKTSPVEKMDRSPLMAMRVELTARRSGGSRSWVLTETGRLALRTICIESVGDQDANAKD